MKIIALHTKNLLAWWKIGVFENNFATDCLDVDDRRSWNENKIDTVGAVVDCNATGLQLKSGTEVTHKS